MKKTKFDLKKILIITNVILVLVVVFLFFKIFSKDTRGDLIIRDSNTQYPFINPILDCEMDNDNKLVIYESKIKNKVDELEEKYNVSHISLYFRDLNNGPWVGINEKETFSPASLLKVPVLMALLKEAEDDRKILDKKIKILPEDVSNQVHQNITFGEALKVGDEYTIEQIAEDMIIKSDNTAVLALFRNINQNYIENVFKSIGVPYKDVATEVSIGVKDYAGFFRVLFNTSYLNREMSNRALEILTKTEYKNGIIAGVPQDIVVSHKFGERILNNAGKIELQLHDCGIVYYPDRPYIICVMTRGENFKDQESVIKGISKYIYDEINKNNNSSN